MGQEADCTVRFSGRALEGKALLETDTLLFRGDFRLAIPFKEIQSLEVTDGALKATFSEGVALFHLGPQAEKWAEKIRNPKGLIDKLGVKPSSKVSVLNVDEKTFREALRERTQTTFEGKGAKESDLLFIGVETEADLKKLKPLVRSIKKEGAIWVISPKGKKGVKESAIFAAAREAGLVAVKVARFSETHTANKFVIPAAARR